MSYYQWAERKPAPAIRPTDIVAFVEHDREAAQIREALRDRQVAR